MRAWVVVAFAAALLGAPMFSIQNALASHGSDFVAPQASFVDVAAQAGLNFKCEHWDKNIGLGARWFIDVFFCASPALGDYNGDGYTDIYFPNTRYAIPAINAERNPQDHLFINRGDGTFFDASKFLNINDKGYSMGAAALDWDNDGDLDVYVANYPEAPIGANLLNSPATTFYQNNGDGTFTFAVPPGLETLNRHGLLDRQFGQAVAVADYDRDGDVDIYRGNYAIYKMSDLMPPALQQTLPDSNNLFRNDGPALGFEMVTQDAGASKFFGRTFAVNFVDFTGDLWPDLFVANDENPDEFYRNNQDGTFTELSTTSNADDPRGAMCSEAEDFDNDGDLDIFLSHYEDENDAYYLNDGTGVFTEASGLGDLSHGKHFLSWACPSIDYDNDGDLDLFVANGHMVPSGGEFFHPEDPLDDNGYELPNHLFKNTLRETGTHSWTDVSTTSGPGLLDRFVSSGAVAHDFDIDGSLELLVVNNNQVPVNLYKNQNPGTGHWLQVDLRGTTSNSQGIGSRVTVTAGDLEQVQFKMTGDTLASGSAAPLHFGLGGNGATATVKVEWPSGLVQTETVSVDQAIRIIEGAGVAADSFAPRVQLDVDGVAGTNGWWKSTTLTLTLDAEDAGFGTPSGVASLAYRLDNGPLTPYTGAFGITGEGYHGLTVHAADAAGNAAWYPYEFRIDSEAPTHARLEPVAGKIYVQDRIVGDSPDGRTIIITPVRTPMEVPNTIDNFVAGVRAWLADKCPQCPNPEPPSATGTVGSTVGSDGYTLVDLTCTDGTSGLHRAEFSLSGTLMRTDRTLPFNWLLDLRGQAAGDYTIESTVYDAAGWPTSDVLPVTVVPTTLDGLESTLLKLIGGI